MADTGVHSGAIRGLASSSVLVWPRLSATLAIGTRKKLWPSGQERADGNTLRGYDFREGPASVKQRIMLVVVIAFNGTTVALAQTQEDRQACLNDAFQFCQDAIPDRERVFSCLASHRDVISAACRSAVAPSVHEDQAPLRKQALHAKSAKIKATSAKNIKGKKISAKSVKRKATSAKSAKGKATFVKRASKTVPRRDRQPLNLVPH